MGEHVSYKGIFEGGSSETPDGTVFLVYRFRFDFSEPVALEKVAMTGWGDHLGNSAMRLLDYDGNVLATEPLTGFNVSGTWTLNCGGATGTTFFYDEFDRSGVVRYRESLSVAYQAAVPEPTSLLFLTTGLGVIGVGAWRKPK